MTQKEELRADALSAAFLRDVLRRLEVVPSRSTWALIAGPLTTHPSYSEARLRAILADCRWEESEPGVWQWTPPAVRIRMADTSLRSRLAAWLPSYKGRYLTTAQVAEALPDVPKNTLDSFLPAALANARWLRISTNTYKRI